MNKIRRVLIVDDNEITCYLNKNLLEEMTVAEQVEAVHNGRQALQYIKGKYLGYQVPANQTDLLFLDLNMPVMGGFEFLEALSELDSLEMRKLVIVILSSSENKKEVEETALFNDLVCCSLVKPLQAEAVWKVINSLTGIEA